MADKDTTPPPEPAEDDGFTGTTFREGDTKSPKKG